METTSFRRVGGLAAMLSSAILILGFGIFGVGSTLFPVVTSTAGAEYLRQFPNFWGLLLAFLVVVFAASVIAVVLFLALHRILESSSGLATLGTIFGVVGLSVVAIASVVDASEEFTMSNLYNHAATADKAVYLNIFSASVGVVSGLFIAAALLLGLGIALLGSTILRVTALAKPYGWFSVIVGLILVFWNLINFSVPAVLLPLIVWFIAMGQKLYRQPAQ